MSSRPVWCTRASSRTGSKASEKTCLKIKKKKRKSKPKETKKKQKECVLPQLAIDASSLGKTQIQMKRVETETANQVAVCSGVWVCLVGVETSAAHGVPEPGGLMVAVSLKLASITY